MSTYSDIRYESGGAVTVYANLAAFPGSGNSVGDYAWATNTKALYIWDGEEWDRINSCLLYTSPSPRDGLLSSMPSYA